MWRTVRQTRDFQRRLMCPPIELHFKQPFALLAVDTLRIVRSIFKMISPMESKVKQKLVIGLLVLILQSVAVSAWAGDAWPQFRGPTSDGHSDAKEVPIAWSEKTNIKWKTEIPGQGWSSPVVLGGQVWMTTALDEGKSLRAICVDQESGKLIHNIEVFHVANPSNKHKFNSYASPTPVLEKGRAYICFGANGSVCIDSATGKNIWENHELNLDHMNGAGSSPVIFKDMYLLCCDGIDVQYVAAVDKNTGKTIWTTKRSVSFDGVAPDVRKAYNTPIVIHNEGHDELISIGAHRVYSYDVISGKELWYCDHPGFSCVSQPLFADGRIYISSSFTKPVLMAIRTDGTGDVTKTHIAWEFKKGVPCRSTPVIAGEGNKKLIFMVTDDGIAHCIRAEDGEQLWQQRVGSGFSASPLLIGGNVYFFSEKGTSTVVKAGDKLEIVEQSNTLDEGCMGTPAVVGKALYLRTKTHLYRIEK